MHQQKILVADDSRTILAVVHKILVSADYDVTLARDGREAVQLSRRTHPDLVILDIQMPEMDGYAACQEILDMADWATYLPIIFLTKHTANHLDALGSELGAYLPKPVCEETLLTTVRSLLPRNALQENASIVF